MKRLTLEQVADALISYDSMEQTGSVAMYFLHITDSGKILPTLAGEDICFTESAFIGGLEGDWREQYETLDNPYFREVCLNLRNKANRYLETWSC